MNNAALARNLYNQNRLGETVDDVLAAFYAHPGMGDQRPFGLDVHQGFEFFLSPLDGRLYRLTSDRLGAIPMTSAEEATMAHNLQEGAVELYLRRMSDRSVLTQKKIVLHAATGRLLESDTAS